MCFAIIFKEQCHLYQRKHSVIHFLTSNWVLICPVAIKIVGYFCGCLSDIYKICCCFCLFFWPMCDCTIHLSLCSKLSISRYHRDASIPCLSIHFQLVRKHVCLSWSSQVIKVLQPSHSLKPSYPLQMIGYDPDHRLHWNDWCSVFWISSYSCDLCIQNLFNLKHAVFAKPYSLGMCQFLLTKIFTKNK